MKKYICECGKEFDKIKGMTGHQSHCYVHKDFIKQEKEAKRLSNGMFKCENPDCGKEHDGSYGSGRFCCIECRRHYSSKIGNQTQIKNGTKKCPTKFKIPRAPYGTWKCNICGEIFETRALLNKHRQQLKHLTSSKRGGWNRDLTKETCQSIANSCLKISESLKTAAKEGRLTGRAKTIEMEELRKKKISNTMKKNPKAGGKRHGSGRGKKGWYKGFYCDSSWELAWVIYNLDHGIKFTRYDGYFEYEFEGRLHKYYPDFELDDGTIVEIKGNEKTAQWKAKLSQFPSNKILQIIGKYKITKYLDYVIKNYGKDFIKIYENRESV